MGCLEERGAEKWRRLADGEAEEKGGSVRLRERSGPGGWGCEVRGLRDVGKDGQGCGGGVDREITQALIARSARALIVRSRKH